MSLGSDHCCYHKTSRLPLNVPTYQPQSYASNYNPNDFLLDAIICFLGLERIRLKLDRMPSHGAIRRNMADLPEDPTAYNDYIEDMRKEQYPMLRDTIYLDHAGTTLYSKALMDRFHADMMGNMFGNPHSASPSSQHSTQQIEDIRLELLRFFGADPEHFDLVFTANATTGIKLVVEAFREQDEGFWYGYHLDSHTSLVGVRGAAKESRCFESDEAVEDWIADKETAPSRGPSLLAYPAQSNMNGRCLPVDWAGKLRNSGRVDAYTLLDAAAFASTSPLDLSNARSAPDFTVVSLYKIFGFPDLGALLVRKDASPLFRSRRYFGGGTVDMVVCLKEQWHAIKTGALHEQLEDGTLPIHSIVALKAAIDTHKTLFGTLDRVSKHTLSLAQRLHDGLAEMKHGNGVPVATIYQQRSSQYSDANSQGPVVAFNLQDTRGRWISTTEVDKLASVKNIHLRTGGLCNPGGVASSLGLHPWEMQENFSAGYRCGAENDILNGKPTGMIRVSLGAMSTLSDVERFLGFVDDFFVETLDTAMSPLAAPSALSLPQLHVESLTVYPIKSCAGWQIPYGEQWEIRREGLAWDREWCIVHKGTGAALSQKRYPRMALIRPTLDFKTGRLHINQADQPGGVKVPLSLDPSYFAPSDMRGQDATVCGEAIKARTYISPAIAEYLTRAIGVPCTLARFPSASANSPSARHSKANLRSAHQQANAARPILLSNESPILTITRSSLNRLNEDIKIKGGKAAHPSVFRANIVLAESSLLPPGHEQPWAEDIWRSMCIGGPDGIKLDFLGGCRRCQMVCVDQKSAEKNEEPFVTLAKTRRFDGRVLFGVHTTLADEIGVNDHPRICVGDAVDPYDRVDV